MSPEITIEYPHYEYRDVTTEPCLEWLQWKIDDGEVGGDTDVIEMDWYEEKAFLEIVWEHPLSEPNKLLLDALVANAPGHERVRKPRTAIIKEVLDACSVPGQKARIIDALDAIPSICFMLDQQEFIAAMTRVMIAASGGHLTSPDVALFAAAIPPGEWT